ncbi:hypothetical protein PS6_007496 [Mucor atramentarius]
MIPSETSTATATTANPHQRAYSVMAVPSELEQHRHNKYKHCNASSNSSNLIWYQEVYKKYGYEPKLKNPSYFGPYLLLQTLGEGEFAKVKAGVHVQTNQEVAIKLMRKDHIKLASLETKLEREISVLKRLLGGELFDYILKHHFLQEAEAKRLFAQLISGVDYMHRKHIVHRDLKLENLLLSKDRDIIITDFGFANRFQVAQEDLMATSCGSPCYAAPELVINDENHYVGTAVDIWSCGVILFAMLCGYLPFDDDPTNPQGANINVLYKYIVSTRLEIPKSMSIDATHLLRRMLVPDPAKRCTMEEIKRHPWLSEHQHLFVAEDNEQEDHMNSATLSSDSRLSSPAAAQDDKTTILPLHEPESREEDVTVQASASPPTTPKASNSSTTTASSSSSSSSSVIHTTANTPAAAATASVTDHVAQSPLPVTTTATSFLQAKFISTLQDQQQQQQPPPRSYQQPMFTNNKIPNRSVSVQPQHHSKYNSKRERTTSEYKQQQQHQKHQSLQILPSVSETTIHDDISFSDKAKLKGQKLMEWFIKRSKSQSTKFPSRSAANQAKVPEKQPQRPISALPNPIRAMPIGKPLGSYAADFNDSKLRLHRGAVDQDALTSKAPNEVLHEIKECLNMMGIDMKKCHDFKIKCVRPARRRPVPEKIHANANAPAGARTRKNTTTIPFKLFFNNNNHSNNISPKTTATTSTTHIIYGEQGIDNGEQVQFNVELSKIENLPGLYVVDIKRTRGNIWAFKFLYHTLLDLLNLGGQEGVGYMAQRRISSEKMEDLVKNRKSYMTTSSSGSSSIVVYQ